MGMFFFKIITTIITITLITATTSTATTTTTTAMTTTTTFYLLLYLCMWVVGLRMAFFCGFRPVSDLFQTNWAVASNLQTQGSSSFL